MSFPESWVICVCTCVWLYIYIYLSINIYEEKGRLKSNHDRKGNVQKNRKTLADRKFIRVGVRGLELVPASLWTNFLNSKKPSLYVYIFHTCKIIIHSLSEAADSVSQMSSLGSLRNHYFLMKNSYSSKFIINVLVRNAIRQSLQVLKKKKNIYIYINDELDSDIMVGSNIMDYHH